MRNEPSLRKRNDERNGTGDEGRVIILSNRVATPDAAAQAGGVAVVLGDVLKTYKGLWIGWSGAVADAHGRPELETLASGGGVLTSPMTGEEFNGYYLGYANSVLWPVFHNRLDIAHLEAGFFAAYRKVNDRFARIIAELIRPGDVVWVHDYHFIAVGQALRRLGVTNRIGFFLHIPFPPAQTFLAVPEHFALAQAFAAYDLVGLQTSIDVGHMLDYLERGASGRILPDCRIRVGDRILSVASFPVGLDLEFFEGAAPRPAQASAGGTRRIIGVDRLDYTKGLPQKLRGFREFLRRNASYRGNAVLTQIAAPTRESVEAYADIRKELESLTGAINGAYSDLDWIPVHYVNRSIARPKLAEIYRSSAVALVTPLRDGMNLVAKEYIAAQDADDPGVLVLSRFAGAAETMKDALIVNPYNIDEIANCLRLALEMPKAERRARHARLMRGLRTFDSHHWCHAFLRRLRHVPKAERIARPTPEAGERMRKALDSLARGAALARAMPAGAEPDE